MKQAPQELALRREQVKEHIESVLSSPENNKYLGIQANPNEDIKSINDTASLIAYLNNNYDRLSSESDLLQGINLYKKEDSLVRDERKKNQEPKNTIYADKIYLFNLIRAAIVFNEYQKNNFDVEEVKQILNKINNLPPDKNLYENNFLTTHKQIQTTYLRGKSDEDITLALAYVELQNTHYNVSTITENGIISSLKLKGFNENIKNKLTELSGKTGINSFSDFIAEKSANIVLNSDEVKVIPTPFSRIIPGLRDAYEDTVYELDGNTLKESSKNYRSDSVLYSGYKAEDNTIEAINTFKEQVGENICLNFLHEDQMEQYRSSSNRRLDNIITSYTPLYQKRDKTMNIFSDIINKIDEKTLAKDELTNEIENIEKCRNAIRENTKVTNSTVIQMNKLVHDIKRGALRKYFTEEELEKIPEILSFHKSPPPSQRYFSPHRIAELFKSSFNKLAKSPTTSDPITAKSENKRDSENKRSSTRMTSMKFNTPPQTITVKRDLKTSNADISNADINTRETELNILVDKLLIRDDSINEHHPEPNVNSLDLNELVDYHLTQYDAKQGITRYIENDNLVRDAQNQKVPSDNSHEAHAWKAQCYNFCRAAKLVMQFHNKPPELPNEFIYNVKDNVIDKESADNFKRDLIWLIANNTELREEDKNTEKTYKKIAKQLGVAINCSTLDDPSYNVATVMNIAGKETISPITGSAKPKDHIVIQSDIKIKGFNEELLTIFKTISKKTNNTDINDYRWYNEQDDFKKFITRQACKKIVEKYNDGDGIIPVIPNQLRDIIPGLKNAYLEKIDHIKVETDHFTNQSTFSIKNIMETSRASLPAYKTDENLTKMALESFKEDTGTGKLYLNSLVTANEKSGPSTLKAALSKMNSASLIELPLNLKRNMGRRNVSDFDEILKQIATDLNNNKVITPEAKKFIETNRLLPGQSLSRKKLLNNIINTENQAANQSSDIQKAIGNLITCRTLMNKKVSWRKYGSLDNHELANAMQIAIYDISKGALSSYSTDHLQTSILTFCKSGKDRTGTTLQWLADLAISRALGIDIETVRNATIKAGQQAYIAGSAGGTTGALGIKNAGGLHSFKRYIEEMVNPLGTSGNSTPKYKKRKNVINQQPVEIDDPIRVENNTDTSISRNNTDTFRRPLATIDEGSEHPSTNPDNGDDSSFVTANNGSEYHSPPSNLNSTNLSQSSLDSLNGSSINSVNRDDDNSVISDVTFTTSPSEENHNDEHNSKNSSRSSGLLAAFDAGRSGNNDDDRTVLSLSENTDTEEPNNKKPRSLYSYFSNVLTTVSGLPALALKGFRSKVKNPKGIQKNISTMENDVASEGFGYDIFSYENDELSTTSNPFLNRDTIQTRSSASLGTNSSNSSVSSDSNSSVSTGESSNTNTGYNIFNFNFIPSLPSLSFPKYQNPLNVFKNLNIFNKNPKSNIKFTYTFDNPEGELKDDNNALIDKEDKKSYLSYLYSAITSPFSRLSTTSLNRKPKHVDDPVMPSQPQKPLKEEVKVNPLLTSSISPKNIDPATPQLSTEVIDELNDLLNASKNTPEKVPEANSTNKPPVIERKEILNNVIKNVINNKINRYQNNEPEEKDLQSLINYHTTQYDLSQGITRYIAGDNLIRDAREQEIPEDNSHEEHAWKAQCYNFCRAAELLITYNYDGKKDIITPKNLIDNIEDDVKDRKSADEFKRSLVWFIADELGEKHTKEIYDKIAEQLDTAINCTVIDDTSYNVATVMNVDGKTVIQSDVKVKGFNQELLSVFTTIANYDPENHKPLELDIYKWYNDHNDFNKFIAREACKKILATYGKGIIPVIPNQLRAIIPGLKNAYLESADVIDDNHNIQTIVQSYRSALPAYKEDTILTTEALKAFKADTGSDKIHLNLLVTGNEQKGHSTLSKIRIRDVKLIQSPLNILRNFGTRDFNSFDVVLKKMANALEGVITPEAKAFIETDRTLPGQSLLLRQMKGKFVEEGVSDDIAKAVKTLVECRELMNRTVSWRLYGSLDNNKLANKIQMVMHDIQNGALKSALKSHIPDSLKNIAILTSCKSGKDRTGTVFQGLTDQGLIRFFGNDKKKEIMDITIKAGHQAYLAGAGGGTTAAFGIKNEGGLNADPKYVNGMVTDLATYGNRTPNYKKEITKDDLDDIALDIESNYQLTEENLKPLLKDETRQNDWDVTSELTDNNEYPTPPTLLSIFRNRFNLFRGNAKVYPKSESKSEFTEENSTSNSETLSERSDASSSDNSSYLNGHNIINNNTSPFEIGQRSVSSTKSTVQSLKTDNKTINSRKIETTNTPTNDSEKESENKSISDINSIPDTTVSSTSIHENQHSSPTTPTIVPIPTPRSIDINLTPNDPQTQMQSNNGIPIHTSDNRTPPQNQTHTHNDTPIQPATPPQPQAPRPRVT